MTNFQKKRLKLIITAVAGAIILIFGGTLGSLYFLSSTSGGAQLRERLGIDSVSGLNIQTTRTDKIVVEESSAIIDANKKVGPSVVSIITTGKPIVDIFSGQAQTQQTSGTGFIVTTDGLIATNKHVVTGGESFTVTTSEGKTFDGKVVATDPTNDLAFLQVEARGLPVAELGDSDRIQVGQWVIAIGNALGELQNSVNVGVVSGKERIATPSDGQGNQESLYGLIQTDAAINPGNSGGPLLNLAGQVIGINTAKGGSGTENIGFAIPVNDLKKNLESYRKHGKIVQTYIGVRYRQVTKAIATANSLPVEEGALLIGSSQAPAVQSGSPAQTAGLKAGDIITKIDDHKITDTNPLVRIIRGYNPGDKIKLTVIRENQTLLIDLTLSQL